MRRTLCLILLLVGCDKGGTVGTETGNALTVGGNGARQSAGLNLRTAAATIDTIEVLGADCTTWTVVARDQTIDALADPKLFELDGAACGVRLEVAQASAVADGRESISVESTRFDLTFEFMEAVAEPTVRFDVGRWLTGLNEQMDDVSRFTRNVRKSTTAHRGDEDEVLDEDSTSDDESLDPDGG